MEKYFAAFWQDALPTVEVIAHPPHDHPRGSILRDLIVGEGNQAGKPRFQGGIELGNPTWNHGVVLELALFNGSIATVECTGGAWRVVR